MDRSRVGSRRFWTAPRRSTDEVAERELVVRRRWCEEGGDWRKGESMIGEVLGMQASGTVGRRAGQDPYFNQNPTSPRAEEDAMIYVGRVRDASSLLAMIRDPFSMARLRLGDRRI